MKILDIQKSLNLSITVLKKYVDFIFSASAFSENLQKKLYFSNQQLHKLLSKDFDNLIDNCRLAYSNFKLCNQEAKEVYNIACKISDMYQEFPDCDLYGDDVIWIQNSMAGLSKENSINALSYKNTELKNLLTELSKTWTDNNFDKFSKIIKKDISTILAKSIKIKDIAEYFENKEQNLD